MEKSDPFRLGFDVTGVLCSYRDRALPGAIETIRTLIENDQCVFTISGGRSTNDSRPVLGDFERAGIQFTQSAWQQSYRSDMINAWGLSLYVDDDLRNLSDISNDTTRLWLPNAHRTQVEAPDGIVVVRNWDEIQSALTALTGVTF